MVDLLGGRSDSTRRRPKGKPVRSRRGQSHAPGVALTALFLLVSFCIGLWKIIAAGVD